MQCENHFCIYWTNKMYCTLDKIALDIQGRCQECIYITIAEKDLKKARNETLERYDEHHKMQDDAI